MSRLGIISGAGDLPHIAMKEALLHGEDPIFLAVKESDFSPGEFQERVIPIHITQIGGLIKTCKKNNINRLILLGKVNKDIILKSFKFDLKSIILMAKMLNKNDYTFFEVASHEFLKNKIEILSQKLYLQTLLLPPGRYTKKKLKSGDLETIQYGMNLAYQLARLDIGQSVVVMDRMTLALEAIEGTDEAIKRGGILSRFKGATLCKSSKPGQDERFDLPTVGLQTLKIMNEYKYKNLSIQSGETLIINPKEFIKFADDSGINVLSYDTKQELSELNKSTKPLP